MKIQLISNKNVFLQFIPLNDEFDQENFKQDKKNRDQFSFDLDVVFSEVDSAQFMVTIQAELTKKDQYLMQMVFVSEFKVDRDIDEAFKTSKFPYVNAPAIAYPFFRSFVANTLVNAGWDVHYLPSVNFEKLYNDKNKKHSEK